MDPRALRQARRDAVAARSAERDAAGRNQKGLVRWRRLRRRVGEALLRWLAPALLRLLARTWRVVRIGGDGFELLKSDRPWIVAMWHGRMLTLMPMRHHARRQIGVLVSPSDDGGLARLALDRFGYRVVRGSLSRGGARALREMHELLDHGGQLVVTPDGPRGPRHAVNVGAAWLARATGAPLLPVGAAVDRAWRLRSWDRFTIPKPFARIAVVYCEPLPIAANADDATIEAATAELRRRLCDAERRGFVHLGAADDLDEPTPGPQPANETSPDREAPPNEHDPNTSSEMSGS